ncbi:hypothetical protein CW231_002162, partial [Neisseria gonorrhoeae]
EKLDHFIEEINRRCKNNYSSIQSILDDENISDTYKNDAIAWGIWNNQLSEDEVENYLKNFVNKKIRTIKDYYVCSIIKNMRILSKL